MLKLHTVERNWRTLLEVLDSVGEHLRQNFGHYDKVFHRCDRYFMQKHGRRADTLQDIVVILNCRQQTRAQVFLNASDFDSLGMLLNQFYKLREVHNSITADILKPLYRYYYLYFTQDKLHQKQLENVINAANTAKIFINSVQDEGDGRKFAPKPFGKEEVKPHRKIWHVLSFLENSLLGLRPILEALEDWQLAHRIHLDGQEIDFLQPLLSYRYGQGDQQHLGQTEVATGRFRQQNQQQEQQQEPKKWEDQLRVHGEQIKTAPTYPKRYGGMVNNYLSAREDYYLQQRVDSYWQQEADLQEWRNRPLLQARPRQQRPAPLAIAGVGGGVGAGSQRHRFEDAGSGRPMEQLLLLHSEDGAAAAVPEFYSYREHGPSVFITEQATGQTRSPDDTPRVVGFGVGFGHRTMAAPGPPASTPTASPPMMATGATETSLPPLGHPAPGATVRVTTDAVRAVRGFDPDTYLEELKGTEMKLQVVRAALHQQEGESAELLAKMARPGRGVQDAAGGSTLEQQQSFDWLKVLRQEKEANVHSLRQRVDLLNFQKKLILSRLQAPLFTY